MNRGTPTGTCRCPAAWPRKPGFQRVLAFPVGSGGEWGYLAFSDGKQIGLAGERAVVGRYDHDIGGIQPEVDLSSLPGSDTVSRIHAALEHIGSQFFRPSGKHVDRKYVNQDIEVGFGTQASGSAIRHSRLDKSEQTLQAVLSPVIDELQALERRPSPSPKIVPMA